MAVLCQHFSISTKKSFAVEITKKMFKTFYSKSENKIRLTNI